MKTGWKRKNRWLWAAAAVIVLAAAFAGYRSMRVRRRAQAAREAMNTVEMTPAVRQNLIESISVTGTIASADARDVSAGAKDVKVLQVNYEEGDYVNAGDVIVVLDSSDLERNLAQAQNSQALSAYKENKSIENASRSYTEAVEDGTDDYAKAVRDEADAKEALQDAEGDVSEAADLLKEQEKELADAKETLAAVRPDSYEGGADAQEYKDALAAAQRAVSAAQSEYTSRHQAYNAAAEAEEKALEAYEQASENLADAARKNDRSIASAADSLEQAEMEHSYSNDSSQQTIENYQEQIESCTMTAPISGVITAMHASAGDTYQGEGNILFSVADQEHFVVSASVDEYDVNSIAKEMPAAVIVEALGEEEIPATVSFVSPVVTGSDLGSSSYAVEIALDETNTDLRIGMTAKASIVLDAAYDVLTVPYDCVTTDEEGNAAVTIDRNGERAEIPVTVGMQGDYYVEVSGEGLEENTAVYYTNPMTGSASSGDRPEDDISFPMPGGGMGGSPGGGMPGGGRGGPGGGF